VNVATILRWVWPKPTAISSQMTSPTTRLSLKTATARLAFAADSQENAISIQPIKNDL